MKLPVAILIIIFSIFGAYAQNETACKRKTDLEIRELTGPVYSVRLTREAVEIAEGDEIGDGWIPSLTIFNRDGYVMEFHAYDDKGSFEYKTLSEFDSAGNKIKETEYDSAGAVRRKIVMAYDGEGNIIEHKSVNANGDHEGWTRFNYNRDGTMDSITGLSKDGELTSTTYLFYNKERNEREEVTYNTQSKTIHRAAYVEKEDGETLEVFNDDGALDRRYEGRRDGKGNLTELSYDKDGKVTTRETYSYEHDSRGNWIKETYSEWVDKDGQLALKRTVIIRRAITYY